MIETIENTPVDINLMNYINTTGWRLEFGKAIKDRCSGGFIYSRGVRIDQAYYDITYTIDSISGGAVDIHFGGVLVDSHTAPGTYTRNVRAVTSEIRMFAGIGVAVEVSSFFYKKVVEVGDSILTMAFAEGIDKWTSFYAFNPDYGFSLKRNLFTVKDGALWRHDVSLPRNNFYGVQYESIIEFPISVALNVIKNFKSIEIQSNKLLVTTRDGIKTSLGQVSDLFAEDFKRYELKDNVTSVDVYDREGAYYANFLRDKNVDLIDGPRLKGDLLTIRLTTIDDRDFKLFSVYVNMDQSSGGS